LLKELVSFPVYNGLTRKDLSISTIRILVPGMEHMADFDCFSGSAQGFLIILIIYYSKLYIKPLSKNMSKKKTIVIDMAYYP